jgi:hypothetical protein
LLARVFPQFFVQSGDWPTFVAALLESPRRAHRPIVFSEPREVEKRHCGSYPAALK